MPFEVAEKCLALLQLAAPVGADGNSNVVSDAATAFYLANAALESALLNVKLNLKLLKDPAFVDVWHAKVTALLAERASLCAVAQAAIEATLEVAL